MIMRVLFITNLFPNAKEPSKGTYSYNIVKNLAKYCDIDVIAPVPFAPGKRLLKGHKASEVSEKLPAMDMLNGINVYYPRYMALPKAGFLHAFFLSLTLRKMIYQLQKKRNYTCINAHWVFPDGVAATKVARELKIPIMITALGCDINLYAKFPLRRPQIENAFHSCDKISAVSEELRQKIISMGVDPGKVLTIPNGVDVKLFNIEERDGARKKLGLAHKNKLILYVGNLQSEKGVQHLLEATQRLMDFSDEDFKLFLVGDGPLRKELADWCSARGLGKNIQFQGAVPNEQVPLWMNAADVLCLPSIREGHPNVIMEAKACGTPVVGTDVGAVPEMVTPYSGLVVRRTDSSDLARSLLKALNTKWDRQKIRESVCKYSWADCSLRYYQALKSISGD